MDSEETKEHILEVAIEVFAQAGFAGAHVAEIAEKAGVNVALIYRYFGSKEGLLDAVVDQFLQLAQAQRDPLFAQQPLPSSPEQLVRLMRWAWEYLHQRRDLLKIVLFESLQENDHSELLFESFDASLLSRLPPELAERRDDEALRLLTAAFFFGATPMMMALIFGEQWAAHYGIEPAVMQERFFTVLEDLYVRPMLQWLDNLQANKRE